jgi:hypothetical protein
MPLHPVQLIEAQSPERGGPTLIEKLTEGFHVG